MADGSLFSRPTSQVLITGLLLYGAYATAYCPCPKLLSCHKKTFWFSVGGAAFIAASC